MTPEDEAFQDIERQTLWRKRAKQASAIKAVAHNLFRNEVIEEVAREIEHMESFGKDTISSFAIYIRSLKT